MRARTLAVVSLGLASGAWLVARDYQRWLSLGVGGVPSTPRGWLKVTRLRTQKHEARDPRAFGAIAAGPHDRTWLPELPSREGPRPDVWPYPVPHRQASQPGTPHGRARAIDIFDEHAAHDPAAVTYRRSFFEKNGEALTVLDTADSPPEIVTAQGEFAHIHAADGSMHVILSPTDAAQVLSRGWGERHPLAGSWPAMPLNYVLLYSPRSVDEAEVVRSIVQAAERYARGSTQEPAAPRD
ncbi:MAG: hypothetical protein FJW64_01550 [Actinobacteria bacterium]|nr:hypothetical protein [Actinomycetota bacterium]